MDEKFLCKSLFLSNIFEYYYCFDYSEFREPLIDFLNEYYPINYDTFNLICDVEMINETQVCIKYFSTNVELLEACYYAYTLVENQRSMLDLLHTISSDKVFKINELAMQFCEYLEEISKTLPNSIYEKIKQ